MDDHTVYHFKKSRAQAAKLFLRMAIGCWLYIAGLAVYEYGFGNGVASDLKLYWNLGFGIASAILTYVYWWLKVHPAIYEATITHERFIVSYPEAQQWSFDVAVADIVRFENRNTLSHAGRGIPQHGILMKDGSFHHISMNYGNSIRKMYKAVHSINPEVSYPSKVNQKVEGVLEKDYDQ